MGAKPSARLACRNSNTAESGRCGQAATRCGSEPPEDGSSASTVPTQQHEHPKPDDRGGDHYRAESGIGEEPDQVAVDPGVATEIGQADLVTVLSQDTSVELSKPEVPAMSSGGASVHLRLEDHLFGQGLDEALSLAKSCGCFADHDAIDAAARLGLHLPQDRTFGVGTVVHVCFGQGRGHDDLAVASGKDERRHDGLVIKSQRTLIVRAAPGQHQPQNHDNGTTSEASYP